MNRKQYVVLGAVLNVVCLPIYVLTIGIHGEFMGVVLSIMLGAPVIILSLLALIPAIRYKEERGLYGLKFLSLYALLCLLLSAMAWPLALGSACILGMGVDAFFYERKMKKQGIDIHTKVIEKEKFIKM